MSVNLKLFNNNPTLKTLKDFCDFYKLRVADKKKKGVITLQEFFDYNKEFLFAQLTIEDRQQLAKKKKKLVDDLTIDDIDKNMTLPCPCYLFIKSEYITYNLNNKHTNFQAQATSAIAFENEKILEYVNDEQYRARKKRIAKVAKYDEQGNEIVDENGKTIKEKRNVGTQVYTTTKMTPGCRVIGWFKTMYYSGKKDENHKTDNIYDDTQSFIDLSPFVTSMRTSVSGNGGSFSLTFPHIPLYRDSGISSVYLDQSIGMKSERLNLRSFNIYSKQMDEMKAGDGYAVKAGINTFDYISWLIQPNDLLFLSFNNMEDLTDDNLADKCWDMICLVDNVSVSHSASGSYSITVSGQDLMKLIKVDSSIHFPCGTSSGVRSVFDNTEQAVKSGDLDGIIEYKGTAQRGEMSRQLSGSLNIFTAEPNDFTIDFVLKTVISHLSNIQVVPDGLFSAWGDERTKFSELKPKNS